MNATGLTPEQCTEETTQTLQNILVLTQHNDLVHLREALSQLDPSTALQDCHSTQFITLFERLNALIDEHKHQLSNEDHMRWLQFALHSKEIASALAQHLIALEDWGRNLPALTHLMITTLFAANEYPSVQRDLLAAHVQRGYQTFHLCCDMKYNDSTRYHHLLDECEVLIGPNPKLLRFKSKAKLS